MSGATCVICGATVDEGRQVCTPCAKILAPHADILSAMFRKYPVEYRGLKYGCISAFTLRARSSFLNKQLKPLILQVELMSNRGCVVIADPKEVKILKEWQT